MRLIVPFVVALVIGSGTAAAAQAPGSFDMRFGDCGVESVPYPTSGSLDTFQVSIGAAGLPDGRFLVLSYVDSFTGPTVLERFNRGGRLDTSFGSVGARTIVPPVGPTGGTSLLRGRLVAAADGSLFVLGTHTDTAGSATEPMIVKLHRDGTLDGSFGTAGAVFFPTLASVAMLVERPDSHLLLAGMSGGNATVVGLTAQGALDSSFGSTGRASGPAMSGVDDLRLQADGRIVVAGTMTPQFSEVSYLAVTRFSAAGALDTGFGSGGLAVSNGWAVGPSRVAVDSNNRIVATASLRSLDTTMVGMGAVRFLSDGTVDSTFGTGGVAFVIPPGAQTAGAADLAVQGDGKIVMTGYVVMAPPDPNSGQGSGVVRLTSSGALDPTFGTGGVTFDKSADGEMPTDLIAAPDGSWIVVAHTDIGGPTLMMVGIANDGADSGGYSLDGYGGVHPFSIGHAPAAAAPFGFPAWPGWDIARGVAAVSFSGGYVLDGFGGLHSFGSCGQPPPRATGAPYWPGWDIARSVAVRSTGGGYVLDGWGGLHPFATGGMKPPPLTGSAYWRGWDIARGIALRPNGTSGYVLDAFGALHPFGGAPSTTGTPYWLGQDRARGVTLTSDGTGGYIVTNTGRLYPFGVGRHPAPPPASHVTRWRNPPVARGVSLVP